MCSLAFLKDSCLVISWHNISVTSTPVYWCWCSWKVVPKATLHQLGKWGSVVSENAYAPGDIYKVSKHGPHHIWPVISLFPQYYKVGVVWFLVVAVYMCFLLLHLCDHLTIKKINLISYGVQYKCDMYVSNGSITVDVSPRCWYQWPGALATGQQQQCWLLTQCLWVKLCALNFIDQLKLMIDLILIWNDLWIVWLCKIVAGHFLHTKLLSYEWRTTNYKHMMTSWNGNIFRITGPLCGEFPGYQ